MKTLNRLNRSTLFVFGALAALAVNFMIADPAAAAPERPAKPESTTKVEKIEVSPEDLAKLREPSHAEEKQENRLNAVNQALEKALSERAKSETDYEHQIDRLAARPGDRGAERAQFSRDLREETRREKRLNWLND